MVRGPWSVVRGKEPRATSHGLTQGILFLHRPADLGAALQDAAQEGVQVAFEDLVEFAEFQVAEHPPQDAVRLAGRRPLSEADRVLGLVLGDLRYRPLGEILQDDLHAFLGHVQGRCLLVSRAVQERYSLR